MGLRLFVPPGEGQHNIVPRRPDVLGANATLQYAVVGSTALAATYTSFASQYHRRVTPSQPTARSALFIRSAARLGLWAGVAGAAINWYYHSAFASVVVAQENTRVKPWRLYRWTKRTTVDDGATVGACIGLAASIPVLFMRRLTIPKWTKCLGMTNIGACAGILGAHGYLQYTGRRQKAYKRLHQRLRKRSLEFWAIFWNKPLMALFSPVVQFYVRHNALWYTSNLDESTFDEWDDNGVRLTKNKHSRGVANSPASTVEPQEEPYYVAPIDYIEELTQTGTQHTLARLKELEEEKRALLEEAEYLLFFTSQKEHEFCHMKKMDHAERQRRGQEILLCEVSYHHLRTAAAAIDIKLSKWPLLLKHKAMWEASTPDSESLQAWLPSNATIEYRKHDPALLIQEMQKHQVRLIDEVRRFEELSVDYRYPKERREKWKKDLEDGRVLLKAADHIIHELEKVQKARKDRQTVVADISQGTTKENKLTSKIIDSTQQETRNSLEKTEKALDESRGGIDKPSPVESPRKSLEPNN